VPSRSSSVSTAPYLRFSGEIRVEHWRGDEVVDQYVTEDAIWELMYFGHARV
jgi:hypothetical protein